MAEFYLGLDPSTKKSGYAIMNHTAELIEYGVVDLGNQKPKKSKLKGRVLDEDVRELTPAEEMLVQHKVFTDLILKYKPKKIVCEDQFFGNNVDTLKKLSRVTGTILLVAAQHNIPIELVYPTQWRKVYHGKGSVKKDDTLKKVNEDFGLKLRKKDNDISDAIGIAAYAHSISVNVNQGEN